MISKMLRKPLGYIKNKTVDFFLSAKIKKIIDSKRLQGADEFDFEVFKKKVICFIEIMKFDKAGVQYRYSSSCKEPTLYASVYASMTLSMLGVLKEYRDEEKKCWIEYFDSFQDSQTGLFYDSIVANEIYSDSDWWGARHLTLHMIGGYSCMGGRPKYQFGFLKEYYRTGAIQEWLSKFDWESSSIGIGDIDNKIMNVGCLLQFQRDAWNDTGASNALEELKAYLKSVINPSTGMWGGFDVSNPSERSRMVQFAYHLYPIFFFDRDYDFCVDKVVFTVLQTQNKYGGYGVKPNSSACEDIDSIDILLKLYELSSDSLKERIRESILAAFDWVLINQVEDGGFVFRLDESFTYGSLETSSLRNHGAMMPTWFRTLSVMYVTRFLNVSQKFVITNCPGYEFQ